MKPIVFTRSMLVNFVELPETCIERKDLECISQNQNTANPDASQFSNVGQEKDE